MNSFDRVRWTSPQSRTNVPNLYFNDSLQYVTMLNRFSCSTNALVVMEPPEQR